MLHELLHRDLGVEDVRSHVCRVGAETRCYRRGAHQLVAAGQYGAALRNNDNYAYFAKAAHAAVQRRFQQREENYQ
jgi:hypothetical protein